MWCSIEVTVFNVMLLVIFPCHAVIWSFWVGVESVTKSLTQDKAAWPPSALCSIALEKLPGVGDKRTHRFPLSPPFWIPSEAHTGSSSAGTASP